MLVSYQIREKCSSVQTTMSDDGKWMRWGVVSSATPASKKSDLYITNRTSAIRFLVDTGAAVSILPTLEYDHASRQPAYDLLVGNRTPAATHCIKVLSLNLGLHKQLTWPFMVADITQSVLQYNCLHRDLVVDARLHCLRHLPTDSVTRCRLTFSPSPVIVHVTTKS